MYASINRNCIFNLTNIYEMAICWLNLPDTCCHKIGLLYRWCEMTWLRVCSQCTFILFLSL